MVHLWARIGPRQAAFPQVARQFFQVPWGDTGPAALMGAARGRPVIGSILVPGGVVAVADVATAGPGGGRLAPAAAFVIVDTASHQHPVLTTQRRPLPSAAR